MVRLAGKSPGLLLKSYGIALSIVGLKPASLE